MSANIYTMICEMCQGKRKIDVVLHGNTLYARSYTRPCPDCKGHGIRIIKRR